MASRQEICKSTSKKLAEAKSRLAETPAVIGFDGFVDEIISIVDKRISKSHYHAVKTIAQFGEKVLRAAGQSSNYELDVKQTKLGGNGPIMANALAAMGMPITYIGSLGYPEPHPVFEEFTRRAKVISIAQPGFTEALEFEDGKLMLGKHQSLKDVNWENIAARVGIDQLTRLMSQAKLVGAVNWTMLPQMSQIWEQMLTDVLPKIGGKGITLFVDLADPEKRTHEDIGQAMKLLAQFQKHVQVILGLNLKESTTIADVIGVTVKASPDEIEPGERVIEDTARAIRQKLGLACVVIHPRRGAAAATSEQTAKFAGPFVQHPKISTGAGDHFNAGFCLGRILGLSLEESLCCGVGTSGYYVRSAKSPSAGELSEFIADLPAPQDTSDPAWKS